MNDIIFNIQDLYGFDAGWLLQYMGPKSLSYFYGNLIRDHYRLLSYFSTLFNNSNIIEIGTETGRSALALSYNNTNKVHSFDIKDEELDEFIVLYGKNNGRINFYLGYLGFHKETVINSPFIFYDTSHNGKDELEFYNWLIKNDYKGLVLFDDIFSNKEMCEFWEGLKTKRYNLTHFGHSTGSGLVCFNDQNLIIKSKIIEIPSELLLIK